MINDLKTSLESALNRYESTGEIKSDPVSWVKEFSDDADREVAALIAALFSYGRVSQIQRTLALLKNFLGDHPALRLKNSDASHWLSIIPKNFRHRFNDNLDVVYLFSWLGEALRQEKTLEDFFLKGVKPNADLPSVLESFSNRLTSLPCLPLNYRKKRGMVFLLPLPSRKSACKRLLLFLRWVVGVGPMDLGLWKKVDPSSLIIPLDTHVLRISYHLGLTKRKDQSLVTALEITESLKKLDPLDPVRFDFAICHLGISQDCPSKVDEKVCGGCFINHLCVTYQKGVRRKLKNADAKSRQKPLATGSQNLSK